MPPAVHDRYFPLMYILLKTLRFKKTSVPTFAPIWFRRWRMKREIRCTCHGSESGAIPVAVRPLAPKWGN